MNWDTLATRSIYVGWLIELTGLPASPIALGAKHAWALETKHLLMPRWAAQKQSMNENSGATTPPCRIRTKENREAWWGSKHALDVKHSDAVYRNLTRWRPASRTGGASAVQIRGRTKKYHAPAFFGKLCTCSGWSTLLIRDRSHRDGDWHNMTVRGRKPRQSSRRCTCAVELQQWRQEQKANGMPSVHICKEIHVLPSV
jgi:hypothetical protein